MSAPWQPSEEDIFRILREQNPWIVHGTVPDALAPPVQRPMAALLHSRMAHSRPHRFQLVLGQRRVGKTTAMYHVVKRLLESGTQKDRIYWLRLDHPFLLELPLDYLVRSLVEIADATPDEPVYVFLDEVVYAREWDLWLKTFYDERWPVRLMATASATAALRDRHVESGVGRWEEQYLTPYLLSELMDLRGQELELEVGETLAATIGGLRAPTDSVLTRRQRELLLVGGFPELLTELTGEELDEASIVLRSQRTLRSDAVERAVYKDIPQSFGIDNPLLLERLLYVLAHQMTGLLSPTNVARDLGMSLATLERYVGYLERAFLVFALPNYSGSEPARQRRGRKVYFVDGAVRNAALQRGTAPLTDNDELGLLRENMVAAHLHALASQAGVRLYHWRSGNDEVDFVYDDPDEPLAVEVGSSERHSRDGLNKLAARYPRFAGRCYLTWPGAPLIPASSSGSGVGLVPLEQLLLAIGRQADRAARARLTAAAE